MRCLLAGLFAFGIGCFVAGCHRASRVTEGNETGTLYVSVNDDPADLDPHVNISGSTQVLLGSLCEGLVNLAEDGKTILPGVAERWEISPDGMTYTFHLRPEATWSDGSPLLAEDVQRSFQRIFDPALGAELAAYGFSIRGARDFAEGRVKDPHSLGMAAPDPHTFVLTLNHPAPYLLTMLGQACFVPLPVAHLEKFNGLARRGGPWTRPENWIGNGAFVLKSWVGNKAVVVEKNPRYWNASAVKLNRIVFIPTEDQMTEERGYRAGQFHITTTVPMEKVAPYRASHSTDLHSSPWLRSDYITFNVARAPFDDARVRRAFSLTIDRARMNDDVLPGLVEPLFSITRDGTGGYHPPRSRTARYDPKEARTLLAEAGYSGAHPFPPVELLLPGNAGYVLRVAEVLQDRWTKDLGVRVTILPTEYKVYLEAERTKKFQVMVDRWGYVWDDPLDPLQIAQGNNPNNDAGWSNAAYDDAYARAENTNDTRERKKAFDAMEEILAEEVPYAPIFSYNIVRLVKPSVRGWQDNPLNWTDFRALSLALAQ